MNDIAAPHRGAWQSPHPDDLPITGRERAPLHAWYARHPETFRRGIAPARAAFFALISVVAFLVTLRVFADVDATAHLVSGAGADRRTGIGLVSVLLIPPVVLLIGITGLFRWSRRWVVRGNAVPMVTGTGRQLPDDYDAAGLLREIALTAGQPEEFVTVIENAPYGSGAPHLIVESSRNAQLVVALVWYRVRRPGARWTILDAPIVLTGPDAFAVQIVLRNRVVQRSEPEPD